MVLSDLLEDASRLSMSASRSSPSFSDELSVSLRVSAASSDFRCIPADKSTEATGHI